MVSEKAKENRLRRTAKKLGLCVRKSRARTITPDNHGGYIVIDPQYNIALAGWNYDLDIDGLEEWLNDYNQL